MDEECEDAANTGSSGRVTDSGSSPADRQTLNCIHRTHLETTTWSSMQPVATHRLLHLAPLQFTEIRKLLESCRKLQLSPLTGQACLN